MHGKAFKSPIYFTVCLFTVTQNPPQKSDLLLCRFTCSPHFPLCLPGLSVTADRVNKEIPALSHKGNISLLGQLLLQGNAQMDSPLSPVGGVLLLEISQIHGTLFILKAFLCRRAVVDRAGALLSIHKPEVHDDTEQVLPFHRSIFTQKVPITQAETAQGSNTK